MTTSSMQKLGDTNVLVEFSSDGTHASIEGCEINGEFVPADWFSQYTLTFWKRKIEDELAKDREDMAEVQRYLDYEDSQRGGL